MPCRKVEARWASVYRDPCNGLTSNGCPSPFSCLTAKGDRWKTESGVSPGSFGPIGGAPAGRQGRRIFPKQEILSLAPGLSCPPPIRYGLCLGAASHRRSGAGGRVAGRVWRDGQYRPAYLRWVRRKFSRAIFRLIGISVVGRCHPFASTFLSAPSLANPLQSKPN